MLQYDESERNNYQYMVVEVAPYFPVSRDRIVEILHAENILARKYFWPGCHNMQPYKSQYPLAGEHLPETNAVAKRVVVLPTGSSLDVDCISGITSVLSALASSELNSIAP